MAPNMDTWVPVFATFTRWWLQHKTARTCTMEHFPWPPCRAEGAELSLVSAAGLQEHIYGTINKIETINRCEKRNIKSILNIAKK